MVGGGESREYARIVMSVFWGNMVSFTEGQDNVRAWYEVVWLYCTGREVGKVAVVSSRNRFRFMFIGSVALIGCYSTKSHVVLGMI